MPDTDAAQLDTLLTDLGIRHEMDAPLGPLTWYNVGGHAQCLAHPASTAQLSELVSQCRFNKIPMRVLGSGANMLVREAGVEGVVIRLDDPAWSQMSVEGNVVTVGAGYGLMRGVHIRADFLYRNWSAKTQATVDASLYLLFFMPSMIFFTVIASEFWWLAFSRGETMQIALSCK